jgi:hypothetical protein
MIFASTSRTSWHASPTNPVRRPLSATQTRLFYARKKLADLLKAAGVERGWP